MADKSGIEWTDATWNPIVGCSVVSPGCTNCYAMAMASRIEAMNLGANTAAGVMACEANYSHTHYEGVTQPSKAGPVWTSKVVLAPERILTTPLQWKRPRKIFVNSMGDLFHESVPDEWIDRVFAVMALSPQHTFQVLTKRSKRMREYLTNDRLTAWSIAADPNAEGAFLSRQEYNDRAHLIESVPTAACIKRTSVFSRFPLPNVWLGATAEDQPRADERRADLEALARQGWQTFVSYEPALGPVDWNGWEFLRQLIAGGESGPKARPPHPDWFRASRDWSAAAGVSFFFKQWGEFREYDNGTGAETVVVESGTFEAQDHLDAAIKPSWITRAGRHITKLFDLPEDPKDGARMIERIGKRRAGSLLDGVEHKAFPQ